VRRMNLDVRNRNTVEVALKPQRGSPTRSTTMGCVKLREPAALFSGGLSSRQQAFKPVLTTAQGFR
jgi:hypothetical protein